MKLSTKCRYGTRAMVEIARRYGQGPVKRREIAQTQDISDSYLENILIALKHGGLIETIRGARGGYVLKVPPGEISLLEVFNALEGPFLPVGCLDSDETCGRLDDCQTRQAWKRLQEAVESVLRKETIQSLLDDEAHNKASNYCI
ncbi:MAG: RrF2 family transcriptional regulator [Desulfohalobiaceae bacterium]